MSFHPLHYFESLHRSHEDAYKADQESNDRSDHSRDRPDRDSPNIPLREVAGKAPGNDPDDKENPGDDGQVRWKMKDP